MTPDVPTQQKAPNHCLAKHAAAAARCATARTAAFDEPLVTAEADAVAASGADATYVDLTRSSCNDQTCPETVEKTAVLHDHHHLTQTFSRSLAETLWQQLEPTLA